MKFLIITNLYEPYSRGGAETIVKTIAHGLLNQNHEVVVLAAGPISYGLSLKEEVIDRVRVFRFFPLNIFFVGNDFKYPKVLRFIWRVIDIFNICSILQLRRVLKSEKPDVVMTHNLVGLGFMIPLAFRAKKIKHIHTLHDVQLIYPSGLLMWGDEKIADNFLLRKIYEKLTRFLFNSPNIVMSPSKWLIRLHENRGFFKNSKNVVIKNPIDYNFSLKKLSQKIGEKLNLCYVGQLENHKGIKWLIDTVISLENIKLEIAGNGSLRDAVMGIAEKHADKIVYHGKVDRKELETIFQKSNALVVPSFCYENLPTVILEAFCAGLPVIASNMGGIPELIQEGKNGFLFTPLDKNSFNDALSKLKNFAAPEFKKNISIEEYTSKLLELAQS